MRFLSMIRINENTGLVPSEQLMADMGELMAEMTREGTLVDTAGLRPTSARFRRPTARSPSRRKSSAATPCSKPPRWTMRSS